MRTLWGLLAYPEVMYNDIITPFLVVKIYRLTNFLRFFESALIPRHVLVLVVEKPVASPYKLPYNPDLPSRRTQHSMNSMDSLENMLCKVDMAVFF